MTTVYLPGVMELKAVNLMSAGIAVKFSKIVCIVTACVY